MKKIVIVLLLLSSAQLLTAQNYKFGKVSVEELEEKFYEKDSAANAAFLYKNRRSYYTLDNTGLKLHTEYLVRLKIYNKEGIDWATHEQILSHSSSNEEQFSSLKAATYNLVDGKIEVTKLSKKEVFKEKVSEYRTKMKFTLPNVKDGSVIEYKYKVSSDFYYSVDPVVAQFSIPVKKLDVSIALLEYFKFSVLPKGHFPLSIKRTTTGNLTLKTRDALLEIAQDDIPAIYEEEYVNNIDNYRAGFVFEIKSFTIPGKVYENYASTWDDVAKSVYESNKFGGQLGKIKFLKEELEILKTKVSTNDDKIAAAYDFVKSKLKWNNYYSKYSKEGIKKAVTEGTGNAADINLLLVSVLNELGLKANPILVSTRSNGMVIIPSTSGFNYVIAGVELGNEVLVLDATEKYGVPGILPLRALNGLGRLVRADKTSIWVSLENKEKSKIHNSLNVTVKEDGSIKGMNRTKYWNAAAMDYRDDNLSTNENDLISSKEAKKGDIFIDEFKLQNKTDLSKPLVELFTFEAEDALEILGNKIMFKPMFFNRESENPFKLDERNYPVDFGTPFEIKNTVRISVPEGYEIASLPENIAIGLPEELGVFKYIIDAQGNIISIISIMTVNTAVYPAEYYSNLKEFYNLVVSKCAENVVIKKGELLK